MSLIVVMEDDAATRTLITSVLTKDGHEVHAADNGADGLALIRRHQPTLVVSDVQMPVMDGFAVLAALRNDASIAAIPMILLTSLQEREHMRQGMNTGADDYITKPFRPSELREAVAAQLARRAVADQLQATAVDTAVVLALDEQKHQLAELYEERLSRELSERWPSGDDAEPDERFANATVLFVDSPQYAAISSLLSSAELAEVVKKFYSSAGDTIALFGARHMQFVGEGMLAVFADTDNTLSVTHHQRAIRAALGLVESGRALQQFLSTRFGDRKLPPFRAAVALSSGPVTLTRLSDPLFGTGAQLLPVGDTVSLTLQLHKKAQTLDWPIVATAQTVRGASALAKTGRRDMLTLPGRTQAIDALELIGLSAAAASASGDFA